MRRSLVASSSPYAPIIGFSRAVRVGDSIAVGGTAPIGADGKTVGVGDPASVDAGEGPLWIAYYFGRGGIMAGVVTGLVLAVLERRRSLAALRLPRLAAWGALGGLTIPWLAAAPQAMLPLWVVLGTGTGVATWALAWRGRQINSGDAASAASEFDAGAG